MNPGRWLAGVLALSMALTSGASRALAQGPGSIDVTGLGSAAESPLVPSTISRSNDEVLLRNPPPPMSGPVDPVTYRLGPGDILQLQMWGRVSRSSLLQVGPEGYVLLPGSGSIRVDGRTLADVRTEVLNKMKEQFHGVSIDLRLNRPRTFRIYLTGQVKGAGPIYATGANRVTDVLTEGLLQDNASRRRIEVIHVSGDREIADLDLFARTGVPTFNPWLHDGDVIQVPVATDFIYAEGALGRPGRFELGAKDSLLTLFHMAGDPTPAASVENALLVRWKSPVMPESLWLRLDDVYEGRLNPALREGDRLYVYYLPQYHLQHEADIEGEVERPGVYPIDEGVHRLSDLVKAAGGFLSTADLTAIRVHRHNPNAGEKDPELDRLLRLSRNDLTATEYDKLTTKLAGLQEDFRVDWTRLQQNRAELDLLLRDGDVVRVERLVSSIRVDGEVRRPGILTYRTGLKIKDYVDQAGGYTDRAWANRVQVTRAVTGQTLQGTNVKTLDPGDFVWIPSRPDKTVWDYGQQTLITLAQIATVVLAIRSIH